MKKKHIILGGIYILILAAIIYFQVWQYVKPELLKTYLDGFGVWAPIIFCLLYLVAVFIPHVGTIMTIVGGLLFSPLWGTIIVIALSSVGSIMPFLIAKKYGRKRIKAKIEKTKYKKYLHHTNKNSFMFVLYLRLIPAIPYELQNYIIGLVDISTSKFFIATFVGLLPGTFVLIYLGNTITDIQPIKLIILGVISLFAILLPLVLKKYTKAKKVLQIESNKKIIKDNKSK